MEHTWATEHESHEEFLARLDAQFEEWYAMLPHAVRFPDDNDPED